MSDHLRLATVLTIDSKVYIFERENLDFQPFPWKCIQKLMKIDTSPVKMNTLDSAQEAGYNGSLKTIKNDIINFWKHK